MENKRPTQSKKFMAFILSNLGWMLFLFYFVATHEKSMDQYVFLVIMCCVVTCGFLQLGYVLGQAAVDKYALTVQKALGVSAEKKDSDDA